MPDVHMSSGAGSQLLVSNCDLLSDFGRIETSVDLQIEAGRITAIAPHSIGGPAAGPVLDASGLLAIPGLVNAHTHSPENCLRGIGQGLALEPWLLRMFRSSGVYSAEDHYICAMAGAIEMLELGVTSVVDHLWMTPPSREAVDGAMRAYRDVGIRATVAPLMNDHDYTVDFARSHGLDLGSGALGENIRLLPVSELISILVDSIDTWHDSMDGRLRVMAGPGGIQWGSDEFLTSMAGAARSAGSGIHIHTLETVLQRDVCLKRFGCSPLVALSKLGVLGPDCSLPHSIHLDPDEITALAESGAVPVHNPAANLRLGSGTAPVTDLLSEGINVALGTDGAASSDNQNLWEAIRLATLVHNDSGSDRWLTSDSTFRMATSGGAPVVGRPGEIGTLTPGSIADISLLDRVGAGLAGAADPVAGMALSESGRGVVHVLVGGRHVVREGRCQTVDTVAVRQELADQVEKRRSGIERVSPAAAEAMASVKRLIGTPHP